MQGGGLTAHPLRALAPHGHITPAAFAHCQLPRSLAGASEEGAAAGGASCSRWAEVAGRMRRHAHLARSRPLLDVAVAMALAAARAPADELQRHLQAMGEAGAEAAVPAAGEPPAALSADYAPLSVGPGNADRRADGIAAVAAGLSREPDCRWVYAAVAVPVARGMAAFAAGGWEAAVDALLPAR